MTAGECGRERECTNPDCSHLFTGSAGVTNGRLFTWLCGKIVDFLISGLVSANITFK